jgi:hypothetical protein
MPDVNWRVGARYCKRPKVVNGKPRAPTANNIRGKDVARPKETNNIAICVEPPMIGIPDFANHQMATTAGPSKISDSQNSPAAGST